MLKVSDAVEAIVGGSRMLRFGMHHRLLNLSQVARLILPAVAARTQKEVTEASVLMTLSRLQTKFVHEPAEAPASFYLDQINVQSGLCAITSPKTDDHHRAFNQVFNMIQEDRGFVIVTQGMREITGILEEEYLARAEAMLGPQVTYVQRGLASLGVRFRSSDIRFPGLLYQILQQLALQQINVVEVASTTMEFAVFLLESDVRLAFDSLYQRFALRGKTDVPLI